MCWFHFRYFIVIPRYLASGTLLRYDYGRCSIKGWIYFCWLWTGPVISSDEIPFAIWFPVRLVCLNLIGVVGRRYLKLGWGILWYRRQVVWPWILALLVGRFYSRGRGRGPILQYAIQYNTIQQFIYIFRPCASCTSKYTYTNKVSPRCNNFYIFLSNLCFNNCSLHASWKLSIYNRPIHLLNKHFCVDMNLIYS